MIEHTFTVHVTTNGDASVETTDEYGRVRTFFYWGANVRDIHDSVARAAIAEYRANATVTGTVTLTAA